MDNNLILKKLRYAFNLEDDQVIELFGKGNLEVTREQISNWMKKDDHPDFETINDKILATFLNGLIIDKRGKKDNIQPPNEKRLNNNLIFRKLKIALTLRDDDIVKIFSLVDLDVSKHEINALFRNPSQKQYRECKDQFLRNFIFGLERKYHVD